VKNGGHDAIKLALFDFVRVAQASDFCFNLRATSGIKEGVG